MKIVKQEFLNGNKDKCTYCEWDNGVWYSCEYDEKGREIRYTGNDGVIDEFIYDDAGKFTTELGAFCKTFVENELHGDWKNNHYNIRIISNEDGTYGLKLYGLGKANWSTDLLEPYEVMHKPLTQLMSNPELKQYDEIEITYNCGVVKEVKLGNFDIQEKKTLDTVITKAVGESKNAPVTNSEKSVGVRGYE